MRRKEILKRKKKKIESHVFAAEGLYKSDRFCFVCSLPLIGGRESIARKNAKVSMTQGLIGKKT